MPLTYQPQYRLHGTSTWTNWGAALSSSTLSVVVGNSTTPLSAVTQYDFQVIASDSFGSTTSNLVSATTTSGVSISSVTLTGTKAFTTGTNNAVVGTIAVAMSSGSFTGTLSLSGADAASFQIVNVSGTNTLETNGTLNTAKTYSVSIVATQSGAGNSPFTSAAQSIVGTAAVTESPAGTSVTTAGPAIINSTGQSWTLVNSGGTLGLQVAVNGAVDGTTNNVVLLYYTNHLVYQENSTSEWWSKSVSTDTWTPTTDPRVVSGLSRQMIFGVTNFSGGGQLTESPAFHTSIGYYPDMTSNYAGQSVDSTGGYDVYGNAGFPWVGAIEFFEFTDPTFNDPNAAASNNSAYVAAWTQAANAYAGKSGIANNTYAVRMCREWPLVDWAFCPWYGVAPGTFTPRVSAATWVAGFRNAVNAYRAVAPNVKICWDYPVGWDLPNRNYNQTQALAFYPGDAYVDIISCDIYFPDNVAGGQFFGDGTSTEAWLYGFGESAFGGGGYVAGFRYSDWAAFAANGFPGISNGGKPIAVPEWADCYQDGTITTKFLNWLRTPSTDAAMTQLLNTTCVFHTYYDIPLHNFGNPNDPALGRLQSTWAPNRYTNWVNFHKGLSPTYTGTFWPTHYAVPGTGTIPSGY